MPVLRRSVYAERMKHRRSLAFIGLALSIAPGAAAQQASFLPLGFLEGGSWSRANGLNADGTVVVGSAQNVTPGQEQNGAVRWTIAGPRDVVAHPFDDGTTLWGSALDVSGALVVGVVNEI